MAEEKRNLETIPAGSLGIISLAGCKTLGEQVDHYLVKWRQERESEHKNSLAFSGYQRDSYILQSKVPRFGTGEGKGVILESVRGMDLYLLVDVVNYSLTYSLCGHENHMSPDDHFQDLKRIISAVGGKARRINVIMPFLYESRQHKRSSRESLDCAIALQELVISSPSMPTTPEYRTQSRSTALKPCSLHISLLKIFSATRRISRLIPII